MAWWLSCLGSRRTLTQHKRSLEGKPDRCILRSSRQEPECASPYSRSQSTCLPLSQPPMHHLPARSAILANLRLEDALHSLHEIISQSVDTTSQGTIRSVDASASDTPQENRCAGLVASELSASDLIAYQQYDRTQRPLRR